ncbi:EF-hand domain-containing protein [Sulfuricurvum sp.]|uniref:EF-hand domain-containing protein n=1 Tax=Sulfuricurvum sp. TaxID=2025608 RepID=UPI003BB0566E
MTVSSSTGSIYSSYSSSGVSSSKQADKPNFEDMAKQLLSSMDSDSSGTIDSAEFSAAAQALASNSSSSTTSNSSSENDTFNTLDSNSDGSLSTDEFMTALKNMTPPEPPQGQAMGGMPPPPPSDSSSESSSSTSSSDIIDAMDTNQDGTVSIDELLAALGDSKKDSSAKNGTSSTTDSSTASSTAQSDTSSQKLSDMMLKNILSYYGNNATSTDTTSLLSISA